MESVASGSTTSSSPIPFDDSDNLASDLQPAPLRLPQRQTNSNLDGSNSIEEERTEDNTSTSTIHRSSPLPKPHITKTISQRRAPAPKLGPLVSKFEILDAVSNVDTDSLAKPKPSAIPRAQGVLKRQDRTTDSLQRTDSIDRYTAVVYSADISPKQIASPPPTGKGSRLPVSALFKTTMGEDVGPGANSPTKGGNASFKGNLSLEYQAPSIERRKDDKIEHGPSRVIPSQTSKRPG
ncbi:hypothetical protein F5Y04DRAFT_196080 [Hypomontagnella monticulosa]|nr:hypothetical protein F5Y04DRAFT_196080 [Hypomontagnella monticulosa]